MQPISKAWMALIDVTNYCFKDCIYCTRFTRHIRQDQKFFMSVEQIIQALDSLKFWPKKIGIIGGEPSLHPDLEEICLVVDRWRHDNNKFVQFFSTGGARFYKYEKLIRQSFNYVAFNKHDDHQQKTCLHQPITVAIQDAVPDAELREYLINNCWVQKSWCPTINHKGAFFCEVAAAMDIILDGPGGYPVEPDWWKKTPKDFKDQVSRYCHLCGMPVPLPRDTLGTQREKFSPSVLNLYRNLKLPRTSDRDVVLYDKQHTLEELKELNKDWDPANYRQDIGGRGFVKGGVKL